MQRGTCRLCKKTKDLSFEHIPPKAAFNSNTKYRSVPYIEHIQNSHKPDYKPNAKLNQGGIGSYCLCRDCNSFLGNMYVSEYAKLAAICKQILREHYLTKVRFSIHDIAPLKILKQVISMFVCINDPWFTSSHHELLTFIKDPKSKELPNKYRIYMYLNNEGGLRNLPYMFMNTHKAVCELTFPPLGFVLNIDNPNTIVGLTEITHFKNIDFASNIVVMFELYNLPTYSAIPIDYRTQEEINQAIANNEKEMSNLESEV